MHRTPSNIDLSQKAWYCLKSEFPEPFGRLDVDYVKAVHGFRSRFDVVQSLREWRQQPEVVNTMIVIKHYKSLIADDRLSFSERLKQTITKLTHYGEKAKI